MKAKLPKEKRIKAGEATPEVAEVAEAAVPVIGLRLKGWRIKARNWCKNGMLRLSGSGRCEWKPDDEDDVTVAELEQLEAWRPRNWEKVKRLHERVEIHPES